MLPQKENHQNCYTYPTGCSRWPVPLPETEGLSQFILDIMVEKKHCTVSVTLQDKDLEFIGIPYNESD